MAIGHNRNRNDHAVLERLAPAGFHIAVRVGFAFPEFERNTLPLAWVHVYTRDAFLLYDPVVRWIYENVGCIRWSEISYKDPRCVIATAAKYDMTYGAAICAMDDDAPGLRTYGSFARSDREFTDGELDELLAHLSLLHRQDSIGIR